MIQGYKTKDSRLVLQKNDVKTCFFLKKPIFCTIFLYNVDEMSEERISALCRECPQVFETYLMLPQLITGSEK